MHCLPPLFHRRISATLSLLILSAAGAAGQGANYPYVLKTLAGTFPLGDGGPATQALLSSPVAVQVDSAGNVYVLDAGNFRIRKITPGGTIGTVAQWSVAAYDMKLGKDGNFYVAALGTVFKVSPAGVATTLAGNGTPSFGGDGGLAVNAFVAAVGAIALDSAGNIYIADASRIREITLDGKIQTVAGTGVAGFGFDNVPPLSTQFYFPSGLAFDSSDNLYIADTFSYRIRKLTPKGVITTIAGNGNVGQPVNGPPTATPMGVPHAVTVDSAGNVFIGDVSFFEILKVAADGSTLTQLAGTKTFGYSDGPASSTYIFNPLGIAVDAAGNVLIAENGGNRVRQLSNGSVRTIAGRLHYAGDGAAATSALLNVPADTAIDAQGNVFILDGANFRIRKVTPDGNISTFAGNGLSGTPTEGTQAASAALPPVYSMAMDGLGNLYLGAFQKIYKINAAGVITTFAGTGAPVLGGTGDGGPATQATFNLVSALAADDAGNVYVGDCCIPRVRKISAASGNVTAFAGTATVGNTGDGGPAISATLSNPLALAADRKGNVYIGDGANNVVRMVTPNGNITTVAGNGTKGNPAEGAPARSTPLAGAAGLATDASGNLYIASGNNIYRVDSAGLIHLASGGGTAAVADGLLATSTVGFGGGGIKVDTNGDLYVADPAGSVVRKLVLDSPSGLTISDGNNQTAPAGSALPKPLKVTVNGRGGVAVPGVTVNFAVTTGSATLSAASAQTDSSGSAGVTVTLGAAATNVGITASIAGSTLPAVQFTEGNTGSNCILSLPIVSSVKSLGDFGGLSTFGAGSWLEVKGSNLATNTRLWGGDDFKGANAPQSLDGTTVSINGNAAFVEYISPAQINVQAPADAATGASQVTVTNCSGTSAAVTLQKVPTAPGMLAPGSFNIGGKQYLVALFHDGTTYVGNPGLIAGVPFRPAKPGDSITAYGIGFGAVTPAVAPGVVVGGLNSISGLAIGFGQTPAATTYAGLAPGAIGLYQFDITVPNVPDGDYQINVSVGGVPVAQTLYLTVHQ